VAHGRSERFNGRIQPRQGERTGKKKKEEKRGKGGGKENLLLGPPRNDALGDDGRVVTIADCS